MTELQLVPDGILILRVLEVLGGDQALAYRDVVVELAVVDLDQAVGPIHADIVIDFLIGVLQLHSPVEPNEAIEPYVEGLVVGRGVHDQLLIMLVADCTQILLEVDLDLYLVLAGGQVNFVPALVVRRHHGSDGIGIAKWVLRLELDLDAGETVTRQVPILVPVITSQARVGDVVRLECEVLLGGKDIACGIDVAIMRFVGIRFDVNCIVEGCGDDGVGTIAGSGCIEHVTHGLEGDLGSLDTLSRVHCQVTILIEEDGALQPGAVGQNHLVHVHSLPGDVDDGEVDPGSHLQVLVREQGVFTLGQVDAEYARRVGQEMDTSLIVPDGQWDPSSLDQR